MSIKEIGKELFLFLLCITIIYTLFEVTSVPNSKEDKKTCGCETCLSDYHFWFFWRYQKNIPPFLSSSYNLSQEDFGWWRQFQHERRDLKYFRKIKQTLFEYFPEDPWTNEPNPEQCRRCAVVGNSRNLLRSHYGKLIDFHDVVFRINKGPTKGFEEDVGNRTTHRIMYPVSASDLDYSTHMVLFAFKIGDIEWLLSGTKGINTTQWFRDVWTTKPVSANKKMVLVLNPAFMRYVHHTWLKRKGNYPSTGFLTVILALHMCDEVSVFGFGADSRGSWSHYFEAQKNKLFKTGQHPGSIEYTMITELGKRGKLSFYTGM